MQAGRPLARALQVTALIARGALVAPFLIVCPFILFIALAHFAVTLGRRESLYARAVYRSPLLYEIHNRIFTFPIGQENFHQIPSLPGRTLHLACGTGFGARIIEQKASETVHLDVQLRFLRAGRRRGRMRQVVAGDAYRLPFRPGSFDSVVVPVAFHHLLDHRSLLAEMKRVLTQSGLIVIFDPVSIRRRKSRIMNSFHDGRIWIYDQQGLVRRARELAAESGFELKSVRCFRPLSVQNYNPIYSMKDVLIVLGTKASTVRRAAQLMAIAAPLLAAPSSATELESAPQGLEGRTVAQRAERNLRSGRSVMRAEMTILSPRRTRPRKVVFRSWDDQDAQHAFIRIEAPPRDKETSFLKLHPNLWMYVPKVERTLRIPPSMMLQPWMASDFTNDDLVRESSVLADYDHVLLGIDPSPEEHEGARAYVVEYRAREDAPVVWGKIVAWIETENYSPLRQDFYDEQGALLRTLRFDDIREVDGRHVPHRWSMTPLDKQGHKTSIQLLEIQFEAEIHDRIFTTENMKSRR